MKTQLAATLSCLALAACGGGGDGGTTTSGTPAASASPTFTFTDPAKQTKGTAVTATYGANGLPGAYSGSSDFTLAQSNETEASGRALAVQFTANGSSVVSETTTGTTTRLLGGRASEYVDPDGTSVFNNEQTSLQFVEFGGWQQSPDPNNGPVQGAPVGFGVWSNQATTTLPGGTATYAGKSIGYITTNADTRVTVSDITVTTDFTTASVASANTLVEDRTNTANAISTSALDFTAAGAISGTGFQATSNSGTMTANGQFYGPNAEEVGGTFNGTQGGFGYGGSFGAKQ